MDFSTFNAEADNVIDTDETTTQQSGRGRNRPSVVSANEGDNANKRPRLHWLKPGSKLYDRFAPLLSDGSNTSSNL